MERVTAVVIADPYSPIGGWGAFWEQLERGFWFSLLQKQPSLCVPCLPWGPGGADSPSQCAGTEVASMLQGLSREGHIGSGSSALLSLFI